MVLREFEGLGLEITTGSALSSVTAVLRGTSPDRPEADADAPVVLLRADMDALSVHEENDLEYRSENAGKMHACGHDLHISMLIGAAQMLAAQRDSLRGDVVFMLQPGEELYDGAAVMVKEGVLEAAGRRVDAAYAMHVFSEPRELGTFSSRSGTIMSADDTLNVQVIGRGGHSSAHYRALDPVTIAAEMVLALQNYVTRRFNVFDPVIIGVVAITGGDLAAPNAIPESVRFSASVRSWSHASQAQWHTGVQLLLAGIAAAHQARIEVSIVPGYPASITDATETAFLAQTASQLFGEQRYVEMQNPMSCSEDFSRVLDEVPGAFVVLSAGDITEGEMIPPDNHSPRVKFDDSVRADGAALYAQLAVDRLAALAANKYFVLPRGPPPRIEFSIACKEVIR